MGRVLAILNRQETARSVLQTARMLAEAFGEEDAWAVHPRPFQDTDFMPTEEVMMSDRREAFEAKADRAAHDVRDAIAVWRPEQDIRGRLRYAEIVGDPARTVAMEARRAATVVIGHPLADDPPEVRAGFHAALFEGGATVLSTPIDLPIAIGRRPVLAWKASAALEKAIATAWPLLQKAEQVTVLHAAERHESEDATSTATVERLRDAGVSCVTEIFVPGQRHLGDAILGEAQRLGSDLLVMGAFTHNPLVEWLRTGATQTMLQHARIPLLMHH